MIISSISTPTIAGQFLYPDNIAPEVDLDYEMGGIGLNNPSQGLQVQAWTMQLFTDPITDISSIYLSAPNTPPTLVYTASSLQNCSFAFDQNMNFLLCFTQSGIAKFYWFDTSVSSYVLTTLPAGSTAPRATLDDKRPLEVGASDIAIFYTRSGNLYSRSQRDRYVTEYLLTTGVVGRVLQCGMSDKLRVQILVGTSL